MRSADWGRCWLSGRYGHAGHVSVRFPPIAVMWDAQRMKAVPVVVPSILLASCSPPEERQHGALMDQIERQVQLPKGAGALNDYARIYTTGGKDQVIAVYVLPSVLERAANQECEDLTSTGTSRRVPCVSPLVQKIKAGERTWVPTSASLPFEDVPACEVITLAYSLRDNHFEELGCVGQRPRT